MKQRNGWVSNSSTCGFLIPSTSYGMTLNDVKQHINKHIIPATHLLYNMPRTYSNASFNYIDSVFKEINEGKRKRLKNHMYNKSCTECYDSTTHTYSTADDLFRFYVKDMLKPADYIICYDDMVLTMNHALSYASKFRRVTDDDIIIESKDEDNMVSLLIHLTAKYFETEYYRLS